MENSNPDVASEFWESGRWAGFTENEWIAARTFIEGDDAARRNLSSVFKDLRNDPSNGFLLQPDDFALLSLVNRDCAGRVEQILSAFPDEFRTRVETARRNYLALINAGTLRDNYEKMIAKQTGDGC